MIYFQISLYILLRKKKCYKVIRISLSDTLSAISKAISNENNRKHFCHPSHLHINFYSFFIYSSSSRQNIMKFICNRIVNFYYYLAVFHCRWHSRKFAPIDFRIEFFPHSSMKVAFSALLWWIKVPLLTLDYDEKLKLEIYFYKGIDWRSEALKNYLTTWIFCYKDKIFLFYSWWNAWESFFWQSLKSCKNNSRTFLNHK